ncbi:complement component C6 [Aphelenchoides avenae]|nr:complement component C6 [Aphelenchus avenae]
MSNSPTAVPNDDVFEEDTCEEEVEDLIGEHTDQLSDISEDERDIRRTTYSENHSRLGTWAQRMRPLMRDHRVCVVSSINGVLAVVNIFLFIVMLIIMSMWAVEYVEVKKRTAVDLPCYFEWSEWGDCSYSCYNDIVPLRKRHVLADTIVQARGKYAENDRGCKEGLEGDIDQAPCNTYKCPVRLSSFKFTDGCFPRNVSKPLQDCYAVREIPLDDALITIDTLDLERPCNCTPGFV